MSPKPPEVLKLKELYLNLLGAFSRKLEIKTSKSKGRKFATDLELAINKTCNFCPILMKLGSHNLFIW